MKKSLILAESPLQLLNAYEVIQHFNLENYTLLVRLSNKPDNDAQILNVLAMLPLNQANVMKLYLSASKRKLADYLKLFFIKIFSILVSYKYYEVYSGNYDSKFFRLLVNKFRRSSVFLLDDGNKSIRIQSEFDREKFFHLFTMFDLNPLSGQKIVKNNYDFIRALSEKSVNSSNKILFLGSGMSEIGIISEGYYLHLIKKISEYYESSGYKLVYIPHRAENNSKLEEIKLNKNIEIAKLNYPIELFGMYLNFKPVMISSFCSTAILTVKMIYDIEVECFHFDYETTPDKDELDNIYQYYTDCGIKVIRVNEYVD